MPSPKIDSLKIISQSSMDSGSFLFKVEDSLKLLNIPSIDSSTFLSKQIAIDSLKAATQPPVSSGSFLSDAADWANVLVTALAFGFSIYTFIRQHEKDRRASIETQEQKERNIKLQWYKDIVITPRIDKLQFFFEQLHTLQDKIAISDMSDDIRVQLISFCKAELRVLRKGFIDFILPINQDLNRKLMEKLDNLIDNITQKIDNETISLNEPANYGTLINQPIMDTYTEVFTLIFSYRGE